MWLPRLHRTKGKKRGRSLRPRNRYDSSERGCNLIFDERNEIDTKFKHKSSEMIREFRLGGRSLRPRNRYDSSERGCNLIFDERNEIDTKFKHKSSEMIRECWLGGGVEVGVAARRRKEEKMRLG
jgi:hypothetical protein